MPGLRDRAIIVGLGNPGPKYELTRHNAGFLLVDQVATEAGIALSREKFKSILGVGSWCGLSLVLLKPLTFMNLSGQAVVPALGFFDVDPTQTILVHDDVDLPWGDVRVKIDGGHGGHKGLRSIFELSGRRDFLRVRIGVGRPRHGSMSDFVLDTFSKQEWEWAPHVFDRARDACRLLIEQGSVAAMNAINGLPPLGLSSD